MTNISTHAHFCRECSIKWSNWDCEAGRCPFTVDETVTCPSCSVTALNRFDDQDDLDEDELNAIRKEVNDER